jgi:hypothetical protein
MPYFASIYIVLSLLFSFHNSSANNPTVTKCEIQLSADSETESPESHLKKINLPENYHRLASQKAFISQYDPQFRSGNIERWWFGGGLCGPVCVDAIASTVSFVAQITNVNEIRHNSGTRVKNLINHINLYQSGRAHISTNIRQVAEALNQQLPLSDENIQVDLEFVNARNDSWTKDPNAIYLVLTRRPSTSVGHFFVLTKVQKDSGGWRAILSDPQNPNQIVWDPIYYDERAQYYHTKTYGFILGVLKITMQIAEIK